MYCTLDSWKAGGGKAEKWIGIDGIGRHSSGLEAIDCLIYS